MVALRCEIGMIWLVVENLRKTMIVKSAVYNRKGSILCAALFIILVGVLEP